MRRAEQESELAHELRSRTVRLVLDVPGEFVSELAEQVAARLDRPASAEGWLDVEGAAEHLAVPVSRVYDLTSRRATTGFPVHKDGSRSYFRASELDVWREAQKG